MLNSMGLGFLFKATDEASPVMKGVSSNLTKASQAAEAARKRVKEVGEGFQKVGTTAAIAGGVIAAGLGAAAFEAAKFQFGVAQIVTEADKAKLPAADIARISKQMATTYGGDLDTQIKALYQGVAAGADDAAKAVALLDGANRLAIAGNTSQETALLGITKVLNNYGMAFDKATDVADAFFVAVKGGQTTVGELGDAIGQVAALGKNAGVSMEELIGALGTAATLGKDTASSAAAMKAALSGIAHPTAEAAAEAAKLGIKFDSTSLRSMGLVKFLNKIQGSAKFSADSMNLLFGSVEAAGLMSALTANKGEALTAMMAGMAKKAGGAEEAFRTMSATLQQAASVLKANIQVALVDLGEAFLPIITYAARAVSAIVKGFNALPDPVKKGIAVVLAVTAGVLLLAGVIGSLVGVVLTSEVPIIAVAAALGFVFQAMLPLIVVGGALVATVLAVKRAFDENIGGLKDTIMPIVKQLELTWRALSQAFSQGGFSGAVRDELNKAENQGIKNFVVNLFAWVARIENFFKGIAKGFSAASDAAGPTFAKFALAIDKLVSAFGRLFGGKQDPAKAADTFDKFGSAGARVGATIEKIAEVVVTGLTYGMGVAASFIDTIRELQPSFGRVWESVKVLWGSLGYLFDAFGMVAAAFGVGGSSADSTGAKIAGFIAMLAELIAVSARVAAFIVGALAGAFYVLAVVVGFVKDIILGAFKSIISGILTVVDIMAKVSDKIAGVFGKDVGYAQKLSAGLTDAVGMGKATPVGGPGWSASGTTAGVARSTPVASPTPLALPETTGAVAAAPTLASMKAGAAAGGGGAGGASPEQMGAAMAMAMKQQPPPQAPPVTIPIFLDSDKIGEAMANKGTSNASRSYQPVPTPAG